MKLNKHNAYCVFAEDTLYAIGPKTWCLKHLHRMKERGFLKLKITKYGSDTL